MKRLNHILLCISIMMFLQSTAQYKIEVLDSNTFTLGEGVVLYKTSFRGLSVVDDQTIWVSGSLGTIARSVDGGKTFVYSQLKGYEKSDFRDIEAFDAKRAIIMSSGTPALILKTIDGGQTWKEVFRQNDSAYFLDAMDFWDDKRGVIVGDPINNHFVLLQTKDGGETWKELDTSLTPKAMEGEAVFAASGTSLRCWGKDEYGFVTGGAVSNIYRFKQRKQKWFQSSELNMTKGVEAQGAFSLALSGNGMIYITGGDYRNDTSTALVNFTEIWKNLFLGMSYVESRLPGGYKSSLEYVEPNIIITCGTSGVEVKKYGSSWVMVTKEPFHVVRKAKKGKIVFLAGPHGKIGKLIY